MASGYELTEQQRRVKRRFEDEVGYWQPSFDPVLRMDPEFFERYREWVSYSFATDDLDPKTKEFILIAVYSQVTHLHEDGIERHVGRAFDEGATVSEVLEVLQIASVLGMHSYMIGAKILDEKMGLSAEFAQEELDNILDEFESKRGYRPDWWGPYIAPDPDYFRTYLDYSSHPWLTGSLDPKVREFIYIANDAAPAHLLEEGIGAHMDSAIELGATAEELAAVFQLASVLALDTILEGLPVLVREAEQRGLLSDAE